MWTAPNCTFRCLALTSTILLERWFVSRLVELEPVVFYRHGRNRSYLSTHKIRSDATVRTRMGVPSLDLTLSKTPRVLHQAELDQHARPRQTTDRILRMHAIYSFLKVYRFSQLYFLLPGARKDAGCSILLCIF